MYIRYNIQCLYLDCRYSINRNGMSKDGFKTIINDDIIIYQTYNTSVCFHIEKGIIEYSKDDIHITYDQNSYKLVYDKNEITYIDNIISTLGFKETIEVFDSYNYAYSTFHLVKHKIVKSTFVKLEPYKHLESVSIEYYTDSNK